MNKYKNRVLEIAKKDYKELRDVAESDILKLDVKDENYVGTVLKYVIAFSKTFRIKANTLSNVIRFNSEFFYNVNAKAKKIEDPFDRYLYIIAAVLFVIDRKGK